MAYLLLMTGLHNAPSRRIKGSVVAPVNSCPRSYAALTSLSKLSGEMNYRTLNCMRLVIDIYRENIATGTECRHIYAPRDASALTPLFTEAIVYRSSGGIGDLITW